MGNIVKFLNELNIDDNWRKIILRKNQPDQRMKDIEMIIRFFTLLERRDTYRKPMKDFISNYMSDNKNLNNVQKNKFKNIFIENIKLISKEIPTKPFRLKAGINIAIYDSVMIAIAVIMACTPKFGHIIPHKAVMG